MYWGVLSLGWSRKPGFQDWYFSRCSWNSVSNLIKVWPKKPPRLTAFTQHACIHGELISCQVKVNTCPTKTTVAFISQISLDLELLGLIIHLTNTLKDDYMPFWYSYWSQKGVSDVDMTAHTYTVCWHSQCTHSITLCVWLLRGGLQLPSKLHKGSINWLLLHMHDFQRSTFIVLFFTM